MADPIFLGDRCAPVPDATPRCHHFPTNEWFIPIKNEYPALEAKYLRLEPAEMLINTAKTEALASVRAHWLPSPQFIITIEDWEYMAGLREKVGEIKRL